MAILETVKFKGSVRWASVPPNSPRKPFEIDPTQPENTSYSIEVECDEVVFKDLLKKGIPRTTELRTDEETGKSYIRLKSNKVKGDYVFADPIVKNSAGETLTQKIGNGSEAIVIADLVPLKTRKGSVLRLKAVQVLKLIPYEDASTAYLDLMEINPTEGLESSMTDLGDIDSNTGTEAW